MVALPQSYDATLEAADRALAAAHAADNAPRPYLGMSALGAECPRQLWYGFRWATREQFDAKTIKRFADGHATEAVAIARLQMLDTLEVRPFDEDTGEQFSLNDFGGHLSGHTDGFIRGLLEAPKTWHVLEIKCAHEDKVRKLDKLRQQQGEKNALRLWNPTYFGQAQLYMHYSGTTRHYLVALTPGGRTWIAVRTDYDPAAAKALIERAKWLIYAERAPERISTDREHFECRWCAYAPICWGEAQPDRHCRTCAHSTPMPDGTWDCAPDGNKPIGLAVQLVGCCRHRYHPGTLADLTPVEHAADGTVTYADKSGVIVFTDRGREQ